MRRRRGRRADRRNPRRSEDAGRALRRLRRPGGDRAEDPARRVQAGRRLVPHRRPRAARRAGLFLFRRPHRRHVPLEGRERLDDRSRRDARRNFRACRRRSSTASPCRATTGAPAWRRWSSTRSPSFDLEGLRAFIAERLPVYARPLFLRFRTELEVTGTFKLREDQSWSPKASILSAWAIPSISTTAPSAAYARVDEALIAGLESGQIRF